MNNYSLQELFSNKISDQERKKFLLDMNDRGVSPEDIARFVEFLLPKDFPSLPLAIDVCGTGGSGLSRINTSTISAFILATLGVKIAKHGNRASSGRFGSFDLLEKLGINIDMDAETLKKGYESEGLAFIFAQKFFPAMRYFGAVRKELGVPTIFNLLGPLLNPARVERQIIGTSSRENAELIVAAGKLLNKQKLVVLTGEDGLDELTLSGKTHLYSLNDGKIAEMSISPTDFGLGIVDSEDIEGGTPEENTEIALAILAGKCSSPHADLVLMNTAFGLFFAGIVRDLREGVGVAAEICEGGKVLEKLERMKNL